ncbi:UNVERIFIED_CONTAM: hypothetical protein NCL1_50790 [Trichonephila clavipes]
MIHAVKKFRNRITYKGRYYRRINHINDTGPPSYRGSNMCYYSPNNRLPYLKEGYEGILIQDPLRASYASELTCVISALTHGALREQIITYELSRLKKPRLFHIGLGNGYES